MNAERVQQSLRKLSPNDPAVRSLCKTVKVEFVPQYVPTEATKVHQLHKQARAQAASELLTNLNETSRQPAPPPRPVQPGPDKIQRLFAVQDKLKQLVVGQETRRLQLKLLSDQKLKAAEIRHTNALRQKQVKRPRAVKPLVSTEELVPPVLPLRPPASPPAARSLTPRLRKAKPEEA